MHNFAKILIYKSNSCYCLNYKIIYNNHNKKLLNKENNSTNTEHSSFFMSDSEKYKEFYSTETLNQKGDTNNLENNIDSFPINKNLSSCFLEKNNFNENTQLLNSSDIVNQDIQQKIMDITCKKMELNQQLNIIKYNKKKIKELKEVYDIDIKLFEKFENFLENDSNFIIPELFQEKFIIFKQLKKNNTLSYETFISQYNKNNDYEYFPLNYHESSYIENNSNEEFDIDSVNSYNSNNFDN